MKKLFTILCFFLITLYATSSFAIGEQCQTDNQCLWQGEYCIDNTCCAKEKYCARYEERDVCVRWVRDQHGGYICVRWERQIVCAEYDYYWDCGEEDED